MLYCARIVLRLGLNCVFTSMTAPPFMRARRFPPLFALLLVCCVYTKPLTKETVRKWAGKIENYLTKLAEEGLRSKELQDLYDQASYIDDPKDGSKTVEAVRQKLGGYFSKKENAAKVIAFCFLFIMIWNWYYKVNNIFFLYYL